VLISIIPILSSGQAPNYRFQLDLSFQSILNYGTRSFSSLEKDNESVGKYQYEWYDIDYKNLTISNGFNLKFAVNWLNREKYVLRNSTSLFAEIYTEEVFYELVDFEIGDTAFFPNPDIVEDVELGYSGSAIFQGISYGVTHEILFLRKFKNRLGVGAGLSYTMRARNDLPDYTSAYAPVSSMRTRPGYWTKQLGVSFQIERSLDKWSWFINLNQEVLTVKKEENKGALFFSDPFSKFPISQNLDYRFPLIIQFGGSFHFGKIK